MHELMRRTGSANPNQFAQWFDEATASWCDGAQGDGCDQTKQVTGTKDQKKWYRIARGQQVLSSKALTQLTRLFPDANEYYWSGPRELWYALWGPLQCLWTIAGSVVHDWEPGPHDPGETFTGPELSFEESLYNFECDLLFRLDDVDEEFDLRDLSQSIALYRLHRAVNELGKTDGVGAYRCVRMCMDAKELQDHVHAFSTFSSICVYGAINAELIEREIRRLKGEPSYRESVGIGIAHIEDYARWPHTFCSAEERKEILHIAGALSPAEALNGGLSRGLHE